MEPDLIMISGLLAFCALAGTVAIDFIQSRRMWRAADRQARRRLAPWA